MKSGKTKCRIIIFFIFSISYFNVQGQTKTYLLETIPTGADVLNNKDEVIGQTPFDLKNYPKKSDTIAIAKRIMILPGSHFRRTLTIGNFHKRLFTVSHVGLR
ncbi:MAG: hypothetical protein IPH33_02905 [Bacteroidetes bacterium]|nr:hypothetical protein [Bacteroidota bacterium]